MGKKLQFALLVVVALSMLLAACNNAPENGGAAAEEPAAEGGGAEGALSGTIEIDGSSTVEPITSAVAEEFAAEQAEVAVNVGTSGTGGGFERFCADETDISNASRPIDEEEIALCEEAGVEHVELKVGTDALTMVTNPETDFVTCLTTEEVIKIFGPDDPAASWSDVNGEFPDEPIEVFAPGTDSGTYDFMVGDVLDLEESRQDYNASENDNIIAQGIQGTPGSWGFFGYAYYVENEGSIKAIEYDGGEGCVAPSAETAQDGSYGLTRPLFIYVKQASLDRPEVEEFVRFYLENAEALVADVGYIAEPDYSEVQSTFDEAVGS